jgi:tRNA(Ile)-lysidine synthase
MHCSITLSTSPQPVEQTDMLLSRRLLNREFANSAPITLGEFQTALCKSRPPTGWGNRLGVQKSTTHFQANPDSEFLAVAFSGGVDSTCLLHLLNQTIRESDDVELRKLSLLALHVDHGFQSTSPQTAAACESFASKRSIPYRTIKIPWWEPPYPPLPRGSTGMEEIGRAARYKILFDAMTRESISVLLMAHHVDDQIETGLMRLARGSGVIGACGMRPVRRWGMGSIKGAGSANEELEKWFYGLSGMRRWVSRPLLEFPKVCTQSVLLCISRLYFITYSCPDRYAYVRQ